MFHHPISPQPDDGTAARAAGLIAVAEDLAGEFSLRPLLERILLRCTELLGCDAGSICSVDEAAGTYRKEADIGVACQSGRVFPLSGGMTGAVVARRAPVWFDRYDDVPGGHVAPESRSMLRGVIGVPLEWRGRIIGACVVFSKDDRRTFGPADAELLRLFAKHAAIALVNTRMYEEAEERARSEAVAAERDRMLAELHDTLAQRLVSVRVHIDSAGESLAAVTASAPPGAAQPDARLSMVTEDLRRASVTAGDALIEARLTLLGLASSPLDGRTLEDALRSEVAWARSTKVAGNFYVIKAVGAAAEQGADLDELLRIGNKVNAVTRTMGMALTSCTPPAKGSPLFELGANEMEMGVGIHGEPGRRREKLASANEIVDELLEAVVSDLPFSSGDNVALMINGLGGTPISELYLLYGRAHSELAKRGIHVRRNYVGEYCTSLDMAGCSITLSRLDDEIDNLLDAPAQIAIRTF